jgi:hypothetical protein
VAGIGDLLHLLGEGLDRVAGNEEGGLEIVFPEQPQQPDIADLAGEDAALDVRRRVAAPTAAALGEGPASSQRDDIELISEPTVRKTLKFRGYDSLPVRLQS